MPIRPPTSLTTTRPTAPEYDDSEFHKYSQLPNEHVLELNTTRQILSQLSFGPWQCTAAAPPRTEEGTSEAGELGKGYDVRANTIKFASFQYKSPCRARVRGPEDYQWLYFEVDMEQVYTLVMQFAPGESFIVCPAIPDEGILSQALLRTMFVDPYEIFLHLLATGEKTRYILVEFASDLKEATHVAAKKETSEYSMSDLDESPYYKLQDPTDSDRSKVYNWRDIEQRLWDCEFGVPVKNIRDGSIFDDITFDEDVFEMSDDDLPSGYDSIDDVLAEIRETYEEGYQSYLARTNALYKFTMAESDDAILGSAADILWALRERLRVGLEENRITDTVVGNREQVSIQQLLDRIGTERDEIRQNLNNTETLTRQLYEDILKPRREMADPLDRKLSSSSHYYLQR